MFKKLQVQIWLLSKIHDWMASWRKHFSGFLLSTTAALYWGPHFLTFAKAPPPPVILPLPLGPPSCPMILFFWLLRAKNHDKCTPFIYRFPWERIHWQQQCLGELGCEEGDVQIYLGSWSTNGPISTALYTLLKVYTSKLIGMDNTKGFNQQFKECRFSSSEARLAMI